MASVARIETSCEASCVTSSCNDSGVTLETSRALRTLPNRPQARLERADLRMMLRKDLLRRDERLRECSTGGVTIATPKRERADERQNGAQGEAMVVRREEPARLIEQRRGFVEAALLQERCGQPAHRSGGVGIGTPAQRRPVGEPSARVGLGGLRITTLPDDDAQVVEHARALGVRRCSILLAIVRREHSLVDLARQTESLPAAIRSGEVVVASSF